jgi:hypothetical protein
MAMKKGKAEFICGTCRKPLGVTRGIEGWFVRQCDGHPNRPPIKIDHDETEHDCEEDVATGILVKVGHDRLPS